jgi:hypothetical protein
MLMTWLFSVSRSMRELRDGRGTGRKRDRSDREKKVREGEMGMGIVGGSFQFGGGIGFSAAGR